MSVELNHKFLTANIPITLKTNERGEIHLGHLSNITGIVLPQVGSNIEVKKNEQVNFWPTDIFECEGTTIKLPFYSGEDYILALGKIGVDSYVAFRQSKSGNHNVNELNWIV